MDIKFVSAITESNDWNFDSRIPLVKCSDLSNVGLNVFKGYVFLPKKDGPTQYKCMMSDEEIKEPKEYALSSSEDTLKCFSPCKKYVNNKMKYRMFYSHIL